MSSCVLHLTAQSQSYIADPPLGLNYTHLKNYSCEDLGDYRDIVDV